MNPDEHAARAETLLKEATDKYRLFANSGESAEAHEDVLIEVTALAALAQGHATLSLRDRDDDDVKAGLIEERAGLYHVVRWRRGRWEPACWKRAEVIEGSIRELHDVQSAWCHAPGCAHARKEYELPRTD